MSAATLPLKRETTIKKVKMSSGWDFRWLKVGLQPAWLKCVPFFAVHAACLAVFCTGVHSVDVILCAFLYFIRMFGVTGGYHRYFAHKTYKTSRVFQFCLACLGCSALQKGPLWWAAHHRHHHKYSDTENDPHSPLINSVWWSHVGWILSSKTEATEWKVIRDLSRFPELRFLNNLHWIPGVLVALACFLIGGWSGLVVGFFVSTVLLYHGTFTVNSLCHLFGTRRFATRDDSRNNPLVAVITLGEGWHNNHHHYQNSVRQGFFWWEIDVAYYMIKTMSWIGLVWDIKAPPSKAKLLATPTVQPAFAGSAKS
jgi:stearoyl-CoA desaturase (Delta-9 desaturase)